MKKNKKIYFIRQNIYIHKTESLGFIIALVIFSMTLYFGTLIASGVEEGINDTSLRIGAQAMLVPSSAVSDYESMLLQSSPSAFYLDRTVTEVLDREGIAYSPQIYLKTLKASCCSAPLQVIGFNPETDFTLRPYVSEMNGNGVTIGSDVGCSDTILLFGTEYPVAGRLTKTGSGFDHSVYVPFDYIPHMFEDSLEMGAEYSIDDINRVYSLILIKDAVDIPNIEGVSVIESSGLIDDMKNTLYSLEVIINIFLVLIGVSSLFTIIVMIRLNIESEKTEINIYRVLGINKHTIFEIFFTEKVIIGLIGVVVGTAIGFSLMMLFGEFISYTLTIPYVSDISTILRSLAVSIITPLIPYCISTFLSEETIYKNL